MGKPDIQTLGKSEIAPYIHGEDPKQRHRRRKQIAIDNKEVVRQWCRDNLWSMEVNSDDHHWIFRKGKLFIEWWPSSAKLVKNHKYDKGMHCHDHLKLIEVLEKQNG